MRENKVRLKHTKRDKHQDGERESESKQKTCRIAGLLILGYNIKFAGWKH